MQKLFSLVQQETTRVHQKVHVTSLQATAAQQERRQVKLIKKPEEGFGVILSIANAVTQVSVCVGGGYT